MVDISISLCEAHMTFVWETSALGRVCLTVECFIVLKFETAAMTS